MKNMGETPLGFLPGKDDNSRVVVSLCNDTASGAALRLRGESFSEDIGWYPQNAVELTAAQVAELRNLLGIVPKPRRAERLSAGGDRSGGRSLPFSVHRAS